MVIPGRANPEFIPAALVKNILRPIINETQGV
jgi:hypothetical protein